MKVSFILFLSLLILSMAATTAQAATCHPIQVRWRVDVSGESGNAQGKWTNEALTAGEESDLQTLQVMLTHQAPSNICSGPLPALPTTIDLRASITWNGFFSFDSTAKGATTTLGVSIAGSSVNIPDEVLTDVSLESRGFRKFSNHPFTTNVNSSFIIFGRMGVTDIVRGNPPGDALVTQAFNINVQPRRNSGVVTYMVPVPPVPVPASLAFGLSGILALAGLRLSRRSRRGACH